MAAASSACCQLLCPKTYRKIPTRKAGNRQLLGGGLLFEESTLNTKPRGFKAFNCTIEEDKVESRVSNRN